MILFQTSGSSNDIDSLEMCTLLRATIRLTSITIQPSHTLSNSPRPQNIHVHGHQNTLCKGFLSWVQRSSPWLHQREQGLVYHRQRLQRGFHQYEHGLLWLLQAIFNRTKGLHGHHQQDSKQNITQAHCDHCKGHMSTISSARGCCHQVYHQVSACCHQLQSTFNNLPLCH